MTKLQETLDAIPNATVEELIALGDNVPALLSVSALTFAQSTFLDQHLTLALMFGMFAAAVENLPTTLEVQHGEMIGFEDRIQMFVAIARVSYKEASQLRSEVDTALGRHTSH